MGMVQPGSVISSTIQKDAAHPSAAEGIQPARQRKKKGSLAAELDPLLTPRLAPGQPGRPKGSANHEWTPEADRTLTELCEKWGPTKAKQIMCRKLQDLGLVDGVARSDTLRKAVEHRMSKLGLPTGQPRKHLPAELQSGGPRPRSQRCWAHWAPMRQSNPWRPALATR